MQSEYGYLVSTGYQDSLVIKFIPAAIPQEFPLREPNELRIVIKDCLEDYLSLLGSLIRH